MRHPFKLVVSIGIVAVLAMSSLASGRGSTTVRVGDDFFAPKKVKIDKGSRIKFNWVGESEHDVIKLSGPGPFFESGVTSGSGVLFKQKFKKKGKYKIICTLHPNMKMTVKAR